MGYYLSSLVICVLLFVGLFLIAKVNVVHVVSLSVGTLVIMCAALAGGMFSEVADTEIWNGKITGKERDTVSCSHSYSCNCKESCSGSGKDRSCSTQCSVCYEHSNDYNWVAHSTIGDIQIDRVDRQGVVEPPRYTKVTKDEPAAKTNTYTNYIKGARNNVLNREGTKISFPMPVYPDSVYDYYNINRAIDTGVGFSNIAEWNKQISLALRELGTSKQVNLIMVFTKSPQEYADQLNAAWTGGKKNDVIVVVGVAENKAEWVKVLSWTKREDFKVNLREALVEQVLNPVTTVQVIATSINKEFNRRHMSEFEYLKYDIEPPMWSIVLAFILFFVPTVVYFAINRSSNKSFYRNKRYV